MGRTTRETPPKQTDKNQMGFWSLKQLVWKTLVPEYVVMW